MFRYEPDPRGMFWWCQKQGSSDPCVIHLSGFVEGMVLTLSDNDILELILACRLYDFLRKNVTPTIFQLLHN